MAKLSPEAEKILTSRTEAAEELRGIDGRSRSISDPAVVRLSNARLYEQSITLRILAGEPIAAAEFRAAGDMVEAALKTNPAPIRVDLEVVSGVTGLFSCQHCGAQNRIEDYVAPSKPEPGRTIDAEVVKEPPATTAKPAKPKPKALDYHPAQDFAKGAPIKSNGGFLGIVYNSGPNAITNFGTD